MTAGLPGLSMCSAEDGAGAGPAPRPPGLRRRSPPFRVTSAALARTPPCALSPGSLAQGLCSCRRQPSPSPHRTVLGLIRVALGAPRWAEPRNAHAHQDIRHRRRPRGGPDRDRLCPTACGWRQRHGQHEQPRQREEQWTEGDRGNGGCDHRLDYRGGRRCDSSGDRDRAPRRRRWRQHRGPDAIARRSEPGRNTPVPIDALDVPPQSRPDPVRRRAYLSAGPSDHRPPAP